MSPSLGEMLIDFSYDFIEYERDADGRVFAVCQGHIRFPADGKPWDFPIRFDVTDLTASESIFLRAVEAVVEASVNQETERAEPTSPAWPTPDEMPAVLPVNSPVQL